MSNNTLVTKLLLRNDTTNNWTTHKDTVLSKGEVGIEWITGGIPKIKIGDGTTTWENLDYFGTNVVINGEGDVIVDASYVDGVLTLTKGSLDIDVGVTSVKTTDDDVVILTPTAATAGAVTIDAKHAAVGANTTKGATADVTINSTNVSGEIKIPKVTVDKYGHTTALTEQTLSITIPTIPNLDVDDTETGNVLTDLTAEGHKITLKRGLDVYSKTEVDNKIGAAVNAAVVLKGTLGTNGTITNLPTAESSILGDAYKVITAGTYASQAAKVGDLFICYESGTDTYTWMLIPSGDDIEDTWRPVKLDSTQKLGLGTSSGDLIFKNVSGNAITVGYSSGFTFDVKTGYTSSNSNYAVKKDTSGNLYVAVSGTNTHNYGKITPANSTVVSALKGNTTAVEAKAAHENLKLTAANKWLVLAGTNADTAGSDEIKFGHAHSGVTKGSYGESAEVTLSSTNKDFVLPYITVDEAGHITSASNITVTLPDTAFQNTNTWRHIAVDGVQASNNSVNASAGVNFVSGTGIKVTVSNSTVKNYARDITVALDKIVCIDGGSASTTDWGVITTN